MFREKYFNNRKKQIVIFIFLILILFSSIFFLIDDNQKEEHYTPDIKSDFDVQIVASELDIPWAIAITSKGEIFLTERSGKIKLIDDLNLEPITLLELDVANIGEAGLLGITLDPNFETNRYLYVYYTYEEKLELINRVSRFRYVNNTVTEEKIIIDNIPGGPIHNGGRIKFGPDNKLYICTGDAGNPKNAQKLDSLSGKILRIESDGSFPEDNPFKFHSFSLNPKTAIYSWGHRNPQGLDWHPITKKLFVTEHGPTGEFLKYAQDEINIVEAGRNYGWPYETGINPKNRYSQPIVDTEDETWAPSGASFYEFENGEYGFIIATLRGNHLRVIIFDDNMNSWRESDEKLFGEKHFSGNSVKSEHIILNNLGRIRDVITDWNTGDIYIVTSNTDGRGSPEPNDDKIIKITNLKISYNNS